MCPNEALFARSAKCNAISLNTIENGLTSQEASKRLEQHGKNKLKEAEKESLFKKFISSLADPMVIMLLVAAAIQAVVAVIEAKGTPEFSDFADVFVILVVVVINTIMSLVQESKAEAAMDALMEMTAATSKVLRDGEVVVVKSEDVTIGDVVIFEAGDAVPADCRIIESHSMKVEEATLTGESVPVSKIVDVLMCKDSKDVALGDRKNMLYSGSTVVYGRGKAVVTGIGMDTEMGKIADALSQAEKEQTPLQKKMAELSTFLTKLVIGICILVFVVGIIEGMVIGNHDFSWSLFGNTALDTFIAAYVIGYWLEPVGGHTHSLAGFFSGNQCANAMAMAFLTVNFAEMMCAINMRSRTGSILTKDMFKNMNWWLFGAFVATTLMTLAAIYIPGLNSVFGIEPGTFTINELLISAALALSTVPAFEIGKAIRRRKNRLA